MESHTDRTKRWKEESGGKTTLADTKDKCQNDKTSEYENKETESGERNNGNKRESRVTLKTQHDHYEDCTHDTTVTHENTSRSSSARLTLVEEYVYGDDGETWSEQERNYELDSEEYVPKKGKIRGFFERIKQIMKKRPATKQVDMLYMHKATPANSDNSTGEEDDYDYTLCKPMTNQSATSDAVPGAKIVTAIFDFNRFSDEEISFQKQDKLKLHKETVSDFLNNCDWCLAEHLATGEKGYIPLPYVTEDIHALEAQSWWFDISRQGAVQLLKSQCSVPGTYIVRPSQSEREVILSLLYMDRKVAHYRIRSQNGRLFITFRRSFYDIFELIAFYKCTAEGLRCKLESPAPKKNPFVYPRNIEVERGSVDITTSFRCGDYGELFTGTFSNTLDVTIATKFKMTRDIFLAEAKVLHNFRQCKHFVRVLAVIMKSEPFMMILGETVCTTLQRLLFVDRGKTITFKYLTEIAAEIAEGMAFLEKENVVHRHLKAENVFACDLYQLKIVHPKLCEMMKVRSSDEHFEDENEWQWTAPEAADDEASFSTKSDVWSFGILLYELITFGKEPYAGLIKGDTLRCLHEGFRLSKPKDGPLPCPVAFYITILKCWHRLPECRPTFHFLADFFHDFEVAIEYEVGLEDANIQDLYMRGPLQHGPTKFGSHTNVNRRLTKKEPRLNPQTSEPQESIPTTSGNLQKEETVEQSAQSNTNGKLQITGGFSVKALYDYEADSDDEISIYPDDIITDVDPVDEGWWIGTTENDARGMFPANFVEILESAYAEVTTNGKLQITGGFSVKALYDYEADSDDEISIYPDDIITDVDPVDEGWWIGTTENGARGMFPANFVEILESAYAEVTKIGKLQITGGFSVKALYDNEADSDDEISIYPDDIITDVDPVDEGWWIGTTENGARGMFPANFVEILESAYAEVTEL